MFIDARADNRTLIGEVARRGQKNSERQCVNHGLKDIRRAAANAAR